MKRSHHPQEQIVLNLRESVNKRKHSRIRQTTNPQDGLCAAHPNHVWAVDFQFDHTSHAQVLKYLNFTDESREQLLATEVERCMIEEDIAKILEALINVYGTPKLVRMDIGNEKISNTVTDWYRFNIADISTIVPGSLWQNPFVESVNGEFRDEFLDVEIVTILLEAQITGKGYRRDYNQNRPHSLLGRVTPHEFTQKWHQNNQGLTTVLAH